VTAPASGGTYADFPACLPRYAWLIREAERSTDRLFHGEGDCKACGERVGTNGKAQRDHVRLHVRQLQQTARQRERENAKRLQQINRLRREGKQ
jgi:hypothetical protein